MTPKTPVIISPDYVIYLENYQGSSVAHCDVFKWSKTVRDKIIEDFGLLKAIHRQPIYAFHTIGDKKHQKFIEMLGFCYVTTQQGTDLRLHEVWAVNI